MISGFDEIFDVSAVEEVEASVCEGELQSFFLHFPSPGGCGAERKDLLFRVGAFLH